MAKKSVFTHPFERSWPYLILTAGGFAALAPACKGDSGSEQTSNEAGRGAVANSAGTGGQTAAGGDQSNAASGGQNNPAAAGRSNTAVGGQINPASGGQQSLTSAGQGNPGSGGLNNPASGGQNNLSSAGQSNPTVGGQGTAGRQSNSGGRSNSGGGGGRTATGGQSNSGGGGGRTATGGQSNFGGGGRTATGGQSNSGGGQTNPASGGQTRPATGGQTNPVSGGQNNSAAGSSGGQTISKATGTCRDVRLTTYTDNGDTVGCGYHRNLPFLSQIVRSGLTFAMNEPFYGSSFNGPQGEACGECWELSTATATAIVMVADLCPIAGNPPCADPNQMNFDLTEPAAAAVGSQGYDPAVARPVACPVTGNIFIEVLDRSWGYFQAAFMNYVVPLRTVEYRPVGSSNWTAMQRRWGSVWDTDDAAFYTVASGAGVNGAGATLRMTSAQGQIVTSTMILSQANSALTQTVDTGVQFDNLLQVPGDTCHL